mmetsp:Transcript_9191/g.23587  ORF Transcript_9191/g.23587 Transcript_9191/m.23587 type:complete len:374 (+) Transcript_9191:1545-2666(+)
MTSCTPYTTFPLENSVSPLKRTVPTFLSLMSTRSPTWISGAGSSGTGESGGAVGGTGGGAPSGGGRSSGNGGGSTSSSSSRRDRGNPSSPAAAATDSATARPTAAAASSGVPGTDDGSSMASAAPPTRTREVPFRGSRAPVASTGRSSSIPSINRKRPLSPAASRMITPAPAGSWTFPVPRSPTATVPSARIRTGNPPKSLPSTSCHTPATSACIAPGGIGDGICPQRPPIAARSSSMIWATLSVSHSGSCPACSRAYSVHDSGVRPAASLACGSAPALSSASTVSTSSEAAPRWRAVAPPSSGALAFRSQSYRPRTSITMGQPREAAYCIAVIAAQRHRFAGSARYVSSSLSQSADAFRSDPSTGTPDRAAK